eukprot:gene17738-19511_t
MKHRPSAHPPKKGVYADRPSFEAKSTAEVDGEASNVAKKSRPREKNKPKTRPRILAGKDDGTCRVFSQPKHDGNAKHLASALPSGEGECRTEKTVAENSRVDKKVASTTGRPAVNVVATVCPAIFSSSSSSTKVSRGQLKRPSFIKGDIDIDPEKCQGFYSRGSITFVASTGPGQPSRVNLELDKEMSRRIRSIIRNSSHQPNTDVLQRFCITINEENLRSVVGKRFWSGAQVDGIWCVSGFLSCVHYQRRQELNNGKTFLQSPFGLP